MLASLRYSGIISGSERRSVAKRVRHQLRDREAMPSTGCLAVAPILTRTAYKSLVKSAGVAGRQREGLKTLSLNQVSYRLNQFMANAVDFSDRNNRNGATKTPRSKCHCVWAKMAYV